MREIANRMHFLNDVGLDYLSLTRSADTLSGGEAQRIRLASQIGSGLTGVMYVLDEPSIGLHQRDNARLIDTLKRLRDLGNSVIVVEHDEEAIHAADHVVDMGPGRRRARRRGRRPGHARRDRAQSRLAHRPVPVGASGRSPLPARRHRRDAKRSLRIVGARGNNLKDVTVDIPVGLFVCVTGVSGSGKSTLINDTLYASAARHLYGSATEPAEHEAIEGLDHFDKVINVDQSPIGRTPRSNPATYTGLFTPIRDLFAGVPESRARGYGPGRFSFNVKGGRCEACQGDGVIKVEMHFLPDVYVPCDVCHGKRYNRETLEVHYQGPQHREVLDMTVEAALELFSAVPAIARKLQTLLEVGLGYIRLGQSATTLSGGEAQRVKLALELSKRDTGRTLFILDEPTTGLHFHDIDLLLRVLHRLRDHGNTVVVIEHNLDVIKTADWVIDLGPEGGDGGGTIIAQGTPEDIAAAPASFTGRYPRARARHRRAAGGLPHEGRPRSSCSAASAPRSPRPTRSRSSRRTCRRRPAAARSSSARARPPPRWPPRSRRHWPAGAPLEGLVITRYGHGLPDEPHPRGRGRTPGARRGRRGGGARDPRARPRAGRGRPAARAGVRRRLEPAVAAGRGRHHGRPEGGHARPPRERRADPGHEHGAQAPVGDPGRAPRAGDARPRARAGDLRRDGRRPDPHRLRPLLARSDHLRGLRSTSSQRFGVRPRPPSRRTSRGARRAGSRRRPSPATRDSTASRSASSPPRTRSLMAAAAFVQSRGITPMVLGDSVTGEAREVAKVYAAIARQLRQHAHPFRPPVAMISGGETTVTIRGDGQGRAMQRVPALARHGARRPREHVGAGRRYRRHRRRRGQRRGDRHAGRARARGALGLDAKRLLANNDGYGFFSALGDLVVTGPTRTNVNDFRIILVL